MGKNLIQQARGKGGPRYRAPSFRYKGRTEYAKYEKGTLSGEIIDFIHCQGHSAPLAQIEYENGSKVLIQAPEGVRVGERVEMGEKVNVKNLNVELLAPGEVPGRLTLWTVSAIENLEKEKLFR